VLIKETKGEFTRNWFYRLCCFIETCFILTLPHSRHICVTQRFVSRARRHICVTLSITYICVQIDYQLFVHRCWLHMLSIIVDYLYSVLHTSEYMW